MNGFREKQRGMTLIVSLVMLVVLTLFVRSMLKASRGNLVAVGNMQAQRQLEAAAQQAIEDRISVPAFFTDAISSTGIWPTGLAAITVTVSGYTVNVSRPRCIWSEPDEGTSATNPMVPETTVWRVQAIASDPVTGGVIDVTQGVRMRMLAGNCPV
jgi:type II secretory pathway pseudopilin PulG